MLITVMQKGESQLVLQDVPLYGHGDAILDGDMIGMLRRHVSGYPPKDGCPVPHRGTPGAVPISTYDSTGLHISDLSTVAPHRHIEEPAANIRRRLFYVSRINPTLWSWSSPR